MKNYTTRNFAFKYWTEEEDKYLIENYHVIPAKKIAEKLGKTYKAVDGRAGRLGITQPKDFWSKDKVQFLKDWYGKIPNKELVIQFEKQFGVYKNSKTIQRKAAREGLLGNPFYIADKSFFDKPNIINSYYAGLIASDGCVWKAPGSTTQILRIELHELDVCILEQFKKDTLFSGEIKYNLNRNSSSIRISCCQNWFSNLEKHYSITPRKCKTNRPTEKECILMPPSSLDNECALAYLIGLVDGDGGINIYKGNYYGLSFSIIGSKPVLDWAKQLISTKLSYFKKPLPSVLESTSVYRFQLIGERAEHFCKQLIEIQTPKMMRKWAFAKAWLDGDKEIINAAIKGRGKKMSMWRAILPVFESRGLTPQEYYHGQS